MSSSPFEAHEDVRDPDVTTLGLRFQIVPGQ